MSNQPHFKLKDGAVKLTCWKNENDKGAFYSVDLVRSYKNDETGEWKDTTSLSGAELLRAANLLTEAYNRIRAEKSQDARA